MNFESWPYKVMLHLPHLWKHSSLEPELQNMKPNYCEAFHAVGEPNYTETLLSPSLYEMFSWYL